MMQGLATIWLLSIPWSVFYQNGMNLVNNIIKCPTIYKLHLVKVIQLEIKNSYREWEGEG